MTDQELHDLLDNIVNSIDSVGDIAAGVAPALIPWIVLGKALDDLIPDLGRSVKGWVEGNKPTAEEKAELRVKLAVLADPDNP